MDIKAAVKQLTHKWKTNNPFELAQLLNIIVMYAELAAHGATSLLMSVLSSLSLIRIYPKNCKHTPAPTNSVTVFYIKAYRRHSSKPTPFSALIK